MLAKAASEDFNTASNARIIKQTMLKNIYIANFSIENEPGLTTEPNFLRFEYCQNVIAENIAIKGPVGNSHKGMVVNMCTDCVFSNFFMEYKKNAHFTTSGGYGISCRAACDNIIFQNFQFVGGWRHCFTTTTDQVSIKDGVPKDIFLINCTSETTSEASFDTHGEGENIFFINCAVNGYRSADSTDTVPGTADTDAFNTRCKHVNIINPMVTNCRGRAISFTTAGYGHSVQGGYIRDIRNGQSAIYIEDGCHDIQINGIHIDNVDQHAIFFENNNDDVDITNVYINNIGTAGTFAAIKVISSENVRITGRIKAGADKAIELTGTTDWVRIDANCRGSAASTLVGSNNITIGSMGL